MLHYLQELFQALDLASLGDAALRVAAIFLCLTVHETCHGLAALALGDPTAKAMHRLSLNPLRHIDWLGLLMMFAAGFGWAKPVPVNPGYFKHPKGGMAVTALAGPLSNLVLAFLALAGCKAITLANQSGAWAYWLVSFLLETSMLSVGLGLFNLIPIPPLDGSKVLFSFLPEKAYYTLMRYERYGMLIMLAIVWLDIGGNFLSNAIGAVYTWMVGLFF